LQIPVQQWLDVQADVLPGCSRMEGQSVGRLVAVAVLYGPERITDRHRLQRRRNLLVCLSGMWPGRQRGEFFERLRKCATDRTFHRRQLSSPWSLRIKRYRDEQRGGYQYVCRSLGGLQPIPPVRAWPRHKLRWRRQSSWFAALEPRRDDRQGL